MRPTVVILGVVLFLLVGTIGWWRYFTREARAMDNAAALVTISDQDALCEVANTSHTRKQKMQLSEVAAYLQHQLGVQTGSRIGVAALGKVPSERVEVISAELTRSGYKITKVMRVSFITEPEAHR
jgi:hypothetical protein